MNSVGTSSVARVLHFMLLIVLWSVGFAAASCPAGQYLDQSSSCVRCTSCHVPNDIVITPCYGRDDTVCGSITDVQSTKIKEKPLPSKNKNRKKPAATENGNTFFETVSSYNIMLGGLKNESKNRDAVIVYDDDEVRLHDSFVGSHGPPKSFDRNGKHIKKDLSSVDEIQTSKPNDISKNSSSKKKPSKPKKTKDEPLGEDDELRSDFANDGVVASLEGIQKLTPTLANKKQAEIANVGSRKIKNETKTFYSDEDEYDISRLEENISEDEDADDTDYENDDENEDDDDEEDNAGEVDEDFDPSFTIDKVETSEKPFGVDDIHLTNVHDDDFTERNKYGVNVEPYVDTTNWQLLILVSAASACFLFFVVVNIYLFFYMKKWRHMKQDFEADVEDLSARINLMQHAGFEADESNNIMNYITQLRGDKSCPEKLSKSTL